MTPPRKYEDSEIGAEYQEWTVIAGPFGKKYLCRCSCGAEHLVDKYDLFAQKSKRCYACARVFASQQNKLWPWTDKHTAKLRRAATHAIQRCTNESHKRYADWGGRGIEVRFNSAFEFVEYLLTLEGCDNSTLVLDRIDNDGHYEPGNLRFTTTEESAYNKRPRRNTTRKYNVIRYHREAGFAKSMAKLRAKGCTYEEIGNLYCLSKSTVHKILSPDYVKDVPI